MAIVALTLQSNDLPFEVIGDEQHVTLLYLGPNPLSQFLYSQLLDSVATVAEDYSGSGYVKTKKFHTFNDNAEVLLLDDSKKSEIVQLRNKLLNEISDEVFTIFKAEETYPTFIPHVTMGYRDQGFELEDNVELPKDVRITKIGVWNSEDNRADFTLHAPVEHYGIKRKSGRYPWGSGENPYQRSRSFMNYYEELKAQGLTHAEIGRGLGLLSPEGTPMTSGEVRAHVAMAKAQIKKDQVSRARALREKSWSNIKIGKELGVNESYVRNLFKSEDQIKQTQVEKTVDMLKKDLDQGAYLDFGTGSELHLDGVTRHTLDNAVSWLQDDGYEVMYIKTPMIGTRDKMVTTKVLVPPGTDYVEDLIKNQDRIQVPGSTTTDAGLTWEAPRAPQSVDSKRIAVRYGPEGGADKDGIIEIRPGVEDLDLGNSLYAQVRIAVDDSHYLKGVAHYSDDMPPGVDIVFNTDKAVTSDKLKVMKPMSDDPENPWGAVIKAGGQRGALNIVNEEGDWEKWSNKLSSQMLSKQSATLAKQQLDLTYEIKKAELEEIKSLQNPTIKKHLLEKYADGADADAVTLKAKELPRTQNHVLIPITDLNPNEIYAPGYRDGERVVLIRHPHAGTFEIPELTVNTKSKTARKILGNTPSDAVGIHPSVAAQLSGADFDGDTVLVIPNPRGAKGVKSSKPLKDLENFNPNAIYGPEKIVTVNGKEMGQRDGVEYPLMGDIQTQTEMGKISNLITDMSLQSPDESELARAVKHSMVVIDAEKHKLDYKQSYRDNDILTLKKKYQLNVETGRAGAASTLISRASSEDRNVPHLKPRPADQGGPIDTKTGAKVMVPSGKMTRRKDRTTGDWVETPATIRVPRMSLTDDAHTLSSGTLMEKVYGDHANKMKGLANSARLEMIRTPSLKYNPEAFKKYRDEVASLNASLALAKSNAPLERKAQTLANQALRQKVISNPQMDNDDKKKEASKLITLYRDRTGASKHRIEISDREWEAIQSGAVSDHKLKEILSHSNLDKVKELATPRTSKGVGAGQKSKAIALSNAGYTQAQIAEALGLSTSTINELIRG